MSVPDEYWTRTISSICGWIYFLAWSLSFYPQPTLNFRRRTTDGLTPDYPLLNVVGFTCYTISTGLFLYSPHVRAQYATRHPASPEPTVRSNDFAFGLHACLLTGVTFSQFWPKIWGWDQASGTQSRPNKVTLGLLWSSVLGIALCVVLALRGSNHEDNEWGWIDVIYAMTYVKLLFTVFKYIPQVVSNQKRKSTAGWSIDQILLDFCGGIFSLLQLLLDSSLQDDWSGLTGNPVKLGLANISLAFDIIFLTQHYILFGPVAVEEKIAGTGSIHEAETETDGLLERAG